MPALLAQKESPAVGRKACEELIRRELFAGIRREELPRVAPLPRLQVGGRVAVRFEAIHELAPRRNREAILRETGKKALMEVGLHGLHGKLVDLLGRLKFRTSYGQNVLDHLIEAAHLGSALAAEMKLDVKLAKRSPLLPDIA